MDGAGDSTRLQGEVQANLIMRLPYDTTMACNLPDRRTGLHLMRFAAAGGRWVRPGWAHRNAAGFRQTLSPMAWLLVAMAGYLEPEENRI